MKTNTIGWIIAILLGALMAITAYRHHLHYLQVATIGISVTYTSKAGYENLARTAHRARQDRRNGAAR